MNDSDTRVNWRDIDTTTEAGRRALDVEIARRLGKKVTVTPRDEYGYLVWQKNQRHELVYLDEWYDSETTETWGMGLPIPDYTSDLNAAASLPYTDDYWLQVSLSPDGDAIAYARVLHNYSSGHGAIRGQDKSEAVARCKAWLAWHDAKSDDRRSDGRK